MKTRTVRTVDAVTFTPRQVERIAHVMEIGRAVLVEDIKAFQEAAGVGESPVARKAMADMAEQFQAYVDEAEAIIELVRAFQDVAPLAFVSAEADVSDLTDVLDEIAAEQ